MYNDLIEALKTLQISEYSNLNIEQVKFQYIHLSKIYHPDSARLDEYKDGKMFIQLSNSYKYIPSLLF